jgi:hypothetical protein
MYNNYIRLIVCNNLCNKYLGELNFKVEKGINKYGKPSHKILLNILKIIKIMR